MDSLLHAANLLILLSYAARDMLWLRALTVLGLALTLGVHLALLPVPEVGALGLESLWIAAFLVLNGLHLVWLLWDRRPLRLDPETAALRFGVFAPLTDAQFRRLLGAASRRVLHTGEGLLVEGAAVCEVSLLLRGAASVRVRRLGRGPVEQARLRPGSFVGEVGFLSDQPASASVVCLGACEVLSWPLGALHTLAQSEASLGAALHGILGMDLADKLVRGGSATRCR